MNKGELEKNLREPLNYVISDKTSWNYHSILTLVW